VPSFIDLDPGKRPIDFMRSPQDRRRKTAGEWADAAVNVRAGEPCERFDRLGLPLETCTGGMINHNRIQQAHRIDAACAGVSGVEVVLNPKMPALAVIALGRRSGPMCRDDRHGFPRSKPKAVKRVNVFQTGEMVRAVIEKGKYRGEHVNLAVVRESGRFDVTVAP